MNQTEWAEREVELACRRENPDWDGKSFDYGCACYQSALKAFRSLCDDGHSGMSWSYTMHLLERLMRGEPLTPIEDRDFDGGDDTADEKDLEIRGLVSEVQCPRLTSLFRRKYADGRVEYTDVERVVCHANGNWRIAWYSPLANRIIDGMFPIRMPYLPPKEPYKVHTCEFLSVSGNGDYDTVGVMHAVTPEGRRVEINRYFTERGGKFVEIGEDEYNELKRLADWRQRGRRRMHDNRQGDACSVHRVRNRRDLRHRKARHEDRQGEDRAAETRSHRA